MGQSGAGKSTTLNLLAGMDYPTKGRIIVDGEDIAHYSSHEQTLYRRYKVGIIFQSYNLISTLTAGENIDLIIDISKSSLTSEEVLRMVGLENRRDHFPNQLSGGNNNPSPLPGLWPVNPKYYCVMNPRRRWTHVRAKRSLAPS